MIFPGWHFSFMNSQIVNDSPETSMNFTWNWGIEKSSTWSLINMVPNFNSSIFSPLNTNMMGGIVDPNLFMQDKMQQYKQQLWNNSFNNWGNSNYGNFFGDFSRIKPQTPAAEEEDKSNYKVEYKALKKLIEAYKELPEVKNNDKLQETIKTALEAKGTTDEKYGKLKALYKKLNPQNIERALLSMDDHKELVKGSGYDLVNIIKEDDIALGKIVTDIYDNISNGKYLKVQLESKDNPDILELISKWNETYNTDDNRSILRALAQKADGLDAVNEKNGYKESIRFLVINLINKANNYKDAGKFNISKAQKDLSDYYYNEINKKDNWGNNDITTLADKFEELYAKVRMAAAEKIRNDISTNYSFLNDIDNTDDIIDKNFISEATRKDLENENIKPEYIPEITALENNNYDDSNADDVVNTLLQEDAIEETSEGSNVFVTKNKADGAKQKFYAIVNEKLVELKNVEGYNAKTKKFTVDGVEKELKDIVGDAETADKISIKDYNKLLKEINKAIKEDKTITAITKELKDWPKDVPLYKSTYKVNEQTKYYVIRNNKFQEIEAYCVNTDGTIRLNDGSKVSYKDLDNNRFTDVDVDTLSGRKRCQNQLTKLIQETKISQVDTTEITDWPKGEVLYKSPRTNGRYRYFIIKNDKLKEIKCINFDDKTGQFRVIKEIEQKDDDGKTVKTRERTDITLKDIDNYIKELPEDDDNFITKAILNKYQNEGCEVAKKVLELVGWNWTNEDFSDLAENYTEISKDNVYYMFKYYENNRKSGDRLLTQIVTEYSDDNKIIDIVKHFIETAIKNLKENGLSDSAIELKELYDKYKDEKDKNHFAVAGNIKNFEDIIYKAYNLDN